MPEKLVCIKDMPPPKSPKKVKQFLGLIGYYQKFVPRFSDLARPLNALTRIGCYLLNGTLFVKNPLNC